MYVFIQKHEHKYSVEMMCRVLQLSRSSYYQWKKNPIGKRKLRSNELDKRIRDAYGQAQGRYGSPRLSKELSETGTPVSRKTVAKHMKDMRLKSKVSRKYKAAACCKFSQGMIFHSDRGVQYA